jgi:hypothetical protein
MSDCIYTAVSQQAGKPLTSVRDRQHRGSSGRPPGRMRYCWCDRARTSGRAPWPVVSANTVKHRYNDSRLSDNFTIAIFFLVPKYPCLLTNNTRYTDIIIITIYSAGSKYIVITVLDCSSLATGMLLGWRRKCLEKGFCSHLG